jgi:hypothetical protein
VHIGLLFNLTTKIRNNFCNSSQAIKEPAGVEVGISKTFFLCHWIPGAWIVCKVPVLLYSRVLTTAALE